MEFDEILAPFWTLWGSPFHYLGVTNLIPGVWNGEICVFCGQPDFRLDFGAKSYEFLSYFGWLKPWFGVEGLSKSQFQWSKGFLDLGLHFNGLFDLKTVPKLTYG